jgi:YidC/Oxa1 family membrane protein insertase
MPPIFRLPEGLMNNKQHPDDQMNMFLALALAMLVLMAWNYFYAGPQLQAMKDKAALEQKAAEAAKTTAGQPAGTVAGTAPAKPADLPAIKLATRDEALKQSPRVKIETPSLQGSIALKGGLIDDITLVKQHEAVDPKSPNVILLSPPSGPKAYFAEQGWQTGSGSQQAMPGADTLWVQSGTGNLTPTSPLTLTFDNGTGLKFTRTIAIDEDYMFKISDAVQNSGTGDVVLTPYSRLYRLEKPKGSGYGGILHEGMLGVFGEDGLKEVTYDETEKAGAPMRYEGKTGGWLGITDPYWATALIPDQKAAFNASFEGRAMTADKPPLYVVEYTGPQTVAAAGQSIKSDTLFYAGAKQVKAIENYEVQHGIKLFNKFIDWGWFHIFTRPLHALLDWLYKLLGNFGLAILATTVLVKAAFYPLANKSYESMAKMKKLQPQLEAMREKHKDDKPRQQQEMMALYQKEKINPLAGCLPMLVQIPVFFALYKVLLISIDMRHAPFYGWIKDLSAPDPTTMFNLFGLLPFSVPAWLMIGVWPLLMGITMFVQMQMSPPQPDPIQQKMFSYMPIFFTYLLASFPAGLVIYWAWNNLLSIIQQWYINKRLGVETPLLENMQRIFRPVLRLFGMAKEETKKS